MPVLLRMARSAYSRGIRRHLKEAGLDDLPRNGPYIVGGMADHGGRPADLVEELGITKQAASQLIDTMATRGYLEREGVPGDRRRISIQLTERGRRAAAAVRHGISEVDTRLSEALSREQMEGLRAGLTALAHIGEALEKAPVVVPGAPPGAPGETVPPLVQEKARRVFERSGLDHLDQHLEEIYGVKVKGLAQLDMGVFRVELGSGETWVARALPAARSLDWAEHDRAVLDFLAESGYPAERAVAGPVSVFEGQAVVVSGYLPTVPRRGRREAIRAAGGWQALGEMLGALQVLPGAERFAGRPGGAWHHLVDGSPAQEVAAALELLATSRQSPAGETAAAEGGGRAYARLEEALAAQDAGDGLPEALVHPDYVLANILATKSGGLVVVDWTGSGWGPRTWSLALLLWSAARQDLDRVDRVVAGYRRYVRLEPEELQRLPALISARPLVMHAWELGLGRKSWSEVDRALSGTEELAEALRGRALEAFSG